MKKGEPRAGGQPPRPRTDAFLQGLARLALSIFFRRIEVVATEGIPVRGPLVVVANHVNSLVDPTLIAGCLPRMPRFLAKSTLWQNKALKPLLEAAGVIPVYRRHDPGVDPERNIEAFAKSWDLLAAGGVLALFPEGVSHNEPFLQQLKTGAARIVLEAERVNGPLGVRIVPVGLVFDAKGKFRSRVLVQAGDPVDPAPELESYREGSEEVRWEAVRRLTARIDDSLDAVTLSHGSWEEARLIARAADLWARPRLDLPTKALLADTVGVRRAFLEGYGQMRRRHPQRTAAVAQVVAEYDALLSGARLRDEQVAAAYPPASVLGFAARSAFALLVRLPLAAIGTVLNWPPYRAAGLFAERLEPDTVATWKIFPSVLVFPAVWLLEALVAGWLAGVWVGLAVLVATPVTGRVALSFHDTRTRLLHEARAFLLLRTRKRLAARLAAKRQDVLQQLGELVDLYQRDTGGEGEGLGATVVAEEPTRAPRDAPS